MWNKYPLAKHEGGMISAKEDNVVYDFKTSGTFAIDNDVIQNWHFKDGRFIFHSMSKLIAGVTKFYPKSVWLIIH